MKKFRWSSCLGFIILASASVIALESFALEGAALKSPALKGAALKSPDGHLQLDVQITSDAKLIYQLKRDGAQILKPSPLGIRFDRADFSQELHWVDKSAIESDVQQYDMRVGKRSHIESHANRQTFTLANATEQQLNVEFRLSNDGLAFRYIYKNPEHQAVQFVDELSGFAFTENARAFMQPIAVAQTGWSNTNPSYEEYYERDIAVGTESPSPAGWAFPALFKINDEKNKSNVGGKSDVWVLLSESGMDGQWQGARLQAKSPQGIYKIGEPMPEEIFMQDTVSKGALFAHSNTSLQSPWRVVAVGSLAQLMESTLGTDLALPAQAMPAVEIKPGHASWSWAILKDDYTTYDVQKKFIDYAAQMHWDYTLIDADWDQKIGYDKVKELCAYAASKNIGILLWYNSSGDWNKTPYTPKSQLLTHQQRQTEFARLRAMGVRGVKIDFFGGDGQSMMAYYVDILNDAAAAGLLVNFHGATLPRGIQRTFPNLMTMEAIRGFEFATFTQDNQDKVAVHAATAPFIRNIFDPMDFTPMVFGDIPNIKRRTRNSFELAESVLFISGIQHFAEIPEGMATVPDYVKTFLQELPREWDGVKFLAGYPGDYLVLARRSGKQWYLAGFNASAKDQSINLDLSFMEQKTGYLIQDAGERSFTKTKINADKKMPVTLKSLGGFVGVF